MSKVDDDRQQQRELKERLVLDGVRQALRSWSELLDSVNLPPDLAAVLATGRVELLHTVTPRALSEEECTELYRALGVLSRTNFALQEHARDLSDMLANVSAQMRGTSRAVAKIEAFANFRDLLVEEGS